jgi:hypothetical protein
MTSHEYITCSPYGHVVFIINDKNGIVTNVICDYLPRLEDMFNSQNLIIICFD